MAWEFLYVKFTSVLENQARTFSATIRNKTQKRMIQIPLHYCILIVRYLTHCFFFSSHEISTLLSGRKTQNSEIFLPQPCFLPTMKYCYQNCIGVHQNNTFNETCYKHIRLNLCWDVSLTSMVYLKYTTEETVWTKPKLMRSNSILCNILTFIINTLIGGVYVFASGIGAEGQKYCSNIIANVRRICSIFSKADL